MTDKPAIPAAPFDPWPVIPVNTDDNSPFDRILHMCTSAADDWTFGPEGPYKTPQPPAHTSRSQIREALLYLLETGFIDIDVDRLDAAEFVPVGRPSKRP